MNKEIRVLGRLISKENLEKYTGDEFKKPIFVNNEYDNVVVVEPILIYQNILKENNLDIVLRGV